MGNVHISGLDIPASYQHYFTATTGDEHYLSDTTGDSRTINLSLAAVTGHHSAAANDDYQALCTVAIVTGSNKGIGLEICRQLASNGVTVILTARDENRGLEAMRNLKASGLSDILFHQLDVTNQANVASLAKFIKTKFNKLDILVNNAGIGGIVIDPEAQKGIKIGIHNLISHENAKKELTNVDGLTVEKVDELVEEFLEDYKEDLDETKRWPANFAPYIVSKAALNGYTRVMARNYPHILINAVCPGYVKTDINYNSGILTVEQGAKGPVMLALVSGHGPSGLFYSQMKVSTF
ncbi:hypothetical protein RHGRI_005796 [Rhododendron griersonianum]|uniref:Uncharacterized protein n=1 Tax=Rhododendron griersonianum TaxID=479676 RepID=A0AAV6LEL3_9ERIC|nr:hypothetical protein RHGRI_005796 [Rhododendron griersonianum]